jgi:O-methyltransferase domain
MINERSLSQSCRRAIIHHESKLLLLERVLPDRVECSVAAQGLVMSDLNLMVIGGGRERTAKEHRALLDAAGFTLTKIIPTQSEVSVIEAEPV